MALLEVLLDLLRSLGVLLAGHFLVPIAREERALCECSDVLLLQGRRSEQRKFVSRQSRTGGAERGIGSSTSRPRPKKSSANVGYSVLHPDTPVDSPLQTPLVCSRSYAVDVLRFARGPIGRTDVKPVINPCADPDMGSRNLVGRGNM